MIWIIDTSHVSDGKFITWRVKCKFNNDNSWEFNMKPQRHPGPWFNIKMSSYRYRKSHCGDKTILRPSYLHNGISYTGKMSSLYWIRALYLTHAGKLWDGCLLCKYLWYKIPCYVTDYGDSRSHTLAVRHICKYYLPCYVTRLWLLKKPPHLSCHAHRQVLSHDYSYLRSHTLVVMHTGKYYFVFLTHVKKNCSYPVISSVIILWW